MSAELSNNPSPERHPAAPPDIHVAVGGQDMGPMDEPAFRQLILDRRVDSSTLAWHPALEQWRPIAELPELAWLLEPPSSIETSRKAAPELAGLGPRIAAGAVDLTIWGLLSILVGVIVFGKGSVVADPAGAPAASGFNLLGQALAWGYFILPMSKLGGGATPGYRLFRLKLVSEADLAPPGVWPVILWYVASYLRFIGWISYFFDSKRRMLHNIVSSTIVITVRRAQP